MSVSALAKMQGKYTRRNESPVAQAPVKPLPVPGPATVVKAAEPMPEFQASIIELGGLLKKAPSIRIVTNEQRLGIEGPRGFQNWPVVGLISRLVFFDHDCGAYLAAREGVVDGENYFV